MSTDDLIDALAAFRLTRLIIDDTIFDRQREWLLKELHVADHDKFAELVTCPWCISVWVAFGVVAARRLAPRPWSFVARALAASTVVGTIDRLVG